MADRPINTALILVGPQTGSEWDLDLEQSDGSRHPLMHITSDDPMGVGYLLSKAAHAMGVDLRMEDARG